MRKSSSIIRVTFGCCAVALVLSTTAISFGETQLEKIGDPVFIPHFAAFSTTWNYSPDFSVRQKELQRIFQAIVGDAYVAGSDKWDTLKTGLLPGVPHDGSYELRSRELVAEYGSVNTDVFLAEEIRGSQAQFGLRTLVPFGDAITGASPDKSNGPILPNDIFPITVTQKKYTRNGSTIIGQASWQIQSLSELDELTDMDGNPTDLSDLHRSHVVLPHNFFAGLNQSLDSLPGNFEIHLILIDKNGNGWETIDKFRVARRPTDVTGDLSYDGALDLHDLNILTQNVPVAPTDGREFSPEFLRLDVNGDETVDVQDVHFWVTDLKSTFVGDTNLDGEVQFDDFLALSANFGQSGGWADGDFDANERVEFPDFLALSANFGNVAEASASAAAVPEPTALSISLFGLLGLIGFRKRR